MLIMGKIKTVIFDIDGTMYDYNKSNRLGLAALESYCRDQFGTDHEHFAVLFREGDRKLQERIGYPCASIHNRLIRFQCMLELLHKPLFPHALEMYACYWDTFLAAMKPYPGLTDWMRQLQEQGITVAVGTNMTAYMQYRKLTVLGVAERIQWMLTSEEAGVEKPESRFYRLCIEKGGVPADSCLFIGDNPECDVNGPLKAGMQAVLFDPDRRWIDQPIPGCKRIERYEEIR